MLVKFQQIAPKYFQKSKFARLCQILKIQLYDFVDRDDTANEQAKFCPQIFTTLLHLGPGRTTSARARPGGLRKLRVDEKMGELPGGVPVLPVISLTGTGNWDSILPVFRPQVGRG